MKAVLILVTAISALSILVANLMLGKIGISGVIRVPVDEQGFESIRLDLVVDTPSGEREYLNISRLKISEPGLGIRFNVSGKASGNLSISMNGVITLVSDKGEVYKIPMPCMLNYGESCFRIWVLIPGYDDYLYLPPGNYDMGIELSWSGARGTGEIQLTIEVLAKRPG